MSYLAHELRDDPVKGGTLLPETLFTSAESLKFSAVLGTISLQSSNMTRPSFSPLAVMSK
jgi:hypothetical protein